PQRVLLDPPRAGEEPLGVVAQLGREAAGPQRDRARHRLLEMGIAGEGGGRLAPPEIVERRGDVPRAARQRGDLVPEIEAEGGEPLVVAQAPEMEAPPRLADPRRQPALE